MRFFTCVVLFFFCLSSTVYSQNDKAFGDLAAHIFSPKLLDSIGENFYHQNHSIVLDPMFYRMLADNTLDETKCKWCFRFLNFIEDNRDQYYHYYGEANWRLGYCFLNKDSKFSKLYFDRAIDFFETKPELYIEHIGFLLSIYNCGLYRPEQILKEAQNLALKNNDAIQSGQILMFQITYYFGINDLKNAELKINELEKFTWTVKDDLQAQMQFYGIFFKAILRIKQNKDISSERSYLLKHHERLNIANYQNIFQFIDEVETYCMIIGQFDPVSKLLYNNTSIYFNENYLEFSYERLYFEYSYSNYLLNTEHLEEAFEICNKNVLIAKEMMYSDLASKYEAMINNIYIQRGNMMEYSLNSGFGDINYKQDGSFSVDYTRKNYFQVRAYRKADEIDKIKYLDYLYSQNYLWWSTEYNKSWLKGIKRDVHQLLGKKNLYYSGALKYLANYYYSEDKCAKGLKLLRKGLKIDLGIYDNLSGEYITAQEQLIPFLISEKKYSELDTLFIYLADQKKLHLEKMFLSFNPVELLMLKDNHERFYSLMVNYSHFRGVNKKFVASMNEYWISLNGLSNSKNIWMLNEIKKDEKYISAYSNVKDLQKKLLSIEKNDYSKSIEYKTINDSLKRIQKFLEHEILNNQLSFAKNDNTKNKLGDYSFAEFNYVNISKVEYFDFTSNKWTDSIKYLVFITNSSDTLVDHFFIENGLELEKELFTDYQIEASDKSKATDLKNEIFYNSFWKPIADKIGDAKTVYVSLGGVYNNINLNTLYNPETGKYLIEEKDIRIVNSARDFVLGKERLSTEAGEKKQYTSTTSALYGFPDYNGNTTTSVDTTDYLAATRDLNQNWIDSLTRGGIKASALPATKVEVEQIAGTFQKNGWKVSTYTGSEASETNIKKEESPRVLHVATHGYFFEDIPMDKSEDRFLGMDRQRVVQDPMLRSGLLFTGANKTLQGEEPKGENGLLSATEASLLNLRETELVVLSACETGRGEIKNSEGVYGLRKAFADAGAQNIIMSLWKVDDKVTQEFMTRFYEIWLNEKTTIREAFNRTQLEIKAKYPQPYYWGAFILVGE